jgi:uncharacterized membrane protein
MNGLLLGCAVIGLASIPLILKLVPPNPFYGFRTARTLADRELWFRVNRFAGWAFLAAAIAGAILIAAWPLRELAVLEFVGPVALALFASIAYLKKAAG